MNTAKEVISLALSEVGYLEKKSNSQLDSKTANAGNNNYTKYARDLDAIAEFYNGKKNGFPWCDVFVDWLFVKSFGVRAAKKLLCQPDKSLGAGCGYSADYYKKKGQFHTKDPQPGDQIFFLDIAGDVAHTGIVYKVNNLYVYTVEGNTSTTAGVISNGGCVAKKHYALDYSRIYGYGRPAYDKEKTEENKEVDEYFTIKMRVLKNGCEGDDVRSLQKILISNGYSCGRWGADGKFGLGTKGAVMSYQEANNLAVDGEVGPETMSCILGVK